MEATQSYSGMYKQTMERTREICVQSVFLPEVGQVSYVLFEEPIGGGERAYAITVRCSGGGAWAESQTVRDITTDRDLALRIFWQVCRGQVTPWGLMDLIPELLP